jgi:3-deoxy-D-manno-octulosonate 8-phosphate phosphatase KdsC-like HAD superfamily phosphatase
MKYVGVPVAPNDAHPYIKEIARFVTKARGGDGVVREFLDLMVKD